MVVYDERGGTASDVDRDAAPAAARFTARPQARWVAIASDGVGAIDKPGVKIIDAPAS